MSHEVREGVARRAFESLGGSPSEKAVLQISCDRSHHLAAIYDTEAGRVFHSVLHSTAHGRRDRYDGAHHGHTHGVPWFDLLDAGGDPAVGDELPAGCECGPYTLSRALLLQHLVDGETHLVIT